MMAGYEGAIVLKRWEMENEAKTVLSPPPRGKTLLNA
jgi:hypothetical protein